MTTMCIINLNCNPTPPLHHIPHFHPRIHHPPQGQLAIRFLELGFPLGAQALSILIPERERSYPAREMVWLAGPTNLVMDDSLPEVFDRLAAWRVEHFDEVGEDRVEEVVPRDGFCTKTLNL